MPTGEQAGKALVLKGISRWVFLKYRVLIAALFSFIVTLPGKHDNGTTSTNSTTATITFSSAFSATAYFAFLF